MSNAEEKWNQKTVISLQPRVWRTVVAALKHAGNNCREDRYQRLIPVALGRVEKALKEFEAKRLAKKSNYDAGEPFVDVEATVHGWVTLAELVLTYGCATAKGEAGRVFIVVCSQIVNGGTREEPTPKKSKKADTSKVIMTFQCVGKGAETWDLTTDKAQEYKEAFPGIDVVTTCRQALQWTIDNPTRRKTASGMGRFLNRWLQEAQNGLSKRGSGDSKPSARHTDSTQGDRLAEIMASAETA